MSFDNPDEVNPYQAPLVSSQLPSSGSSHMPLATRGSRLAAAILDGLIGLLVFMPVAWFTGYLTRAMANTIGIGELLIMTLFGLVLFLAIHGYLLATRGQTVGKMLMKIQVVDYQTNKILSMGKLIGLRYLPLWILQMIPFVSMLGLVDVLFIFGSERRCVHDLIAGTHVIEYAG